MIRCNQGSCTLIPPTGYTIQQFNDKLYDWKNKTKRRYVREALYKDATGNPTKSAPVNKLLPIIRKKAVSGLGVPSSARRALTDSEFESMMDIIENRIGSSNIFLHGNLAYFVYFLVVALGVRDGQFYSFLKHVALKDIIYPVMN